MLHLTGGVTHDTLVKTKVVVATQFTHPAEHMETIDTSRFECIDGQLMERPLTTVKHSIIQGNLTVLLRPPAKKRNMTS